MAVLNVSWVPHINTERFWKHFLSFSFMLAKATSPGSPCLLWWGNQPAQPPQTEHDNPSCEPLAKCLGHIKREFTSHNVLNPTNFSWFKSSLSPEFAYTMIRGNHGVSHVSEGHAACGLCSSRSQRNKGTGKVPRSCLRWDNCRRVGGHQRGGWRKTLQSSIENRSQSFELGIFDM